MALLVLALFGFAHNLRGDEVAPIPRIELPDLRGSTLPEAESALAALGLVVEARFESNEDLAPDTVFGQDPRAGRKAEQGSAVQLLVSSGRVGNPVPDLVGQPEAAAVAAVTAAGFTPVVERQFSDRVPVGLVMRTDPDAYTPLAPALDVHLDVSDGPRARQVPVLTNLYLEQALVLVGRAGLVPGEVTEVYEPGIEAGIVRLQLPAPDTAVAKNTPVALTVSALPPRIEVPWVAGISQASAEEQLTDAGVDYEVELELVTDPADVGRVIRQSIPGGLLVTAKVTVEITVGSATDPADTADPDDEDDGG